MEIHEFSTLSTGFSTVVNRCVKYNLVYIIILNKKSGFATFPVFGKMPGGGKKGIKTGLDRPETENITHKLPETRKNFKKGIDFMGKAGYNAYLYEQVWE